MSKSRTLFIGAVSFALLWLIGKGSSLNRAANNLIFEPENYKIKYDKAKSKFILTMSIRLINPDSTVSFQVQRPEIQLFYKGGLIGFTIPKFELTTIAPKGISYIHQVVFELSISFIKAILPEMNLQNLVTLLVSFQFSKVADEISKNTDKIMKHFTMRAQTEVNGIPVVVDNITFV